MAETARMRGLLAELGRGNGGEGLEHLGFWGESVAGVFGYHYGHIKLTITGPNEYRIVDLTWLKGDVNGLERAIEQKKRRVHWKKLCDDSRKVYFKKKIESGDPPLANLSDLQAQAENGNWDREMTLTLL